MQKQKFFIAYKIVGTEKKEKKKYMKRKFKLISSIASLTAAVALLVVGVAAAGTRNVGVDGTVGFTATKVNASVVVSEKRNNAEDFTPLGEAQTFSATLEGNQTGEDVVLEAITLNDENILVYEYRIQVTNTFTADNDILVVFDWTNYEGEAVPTQAGMTIVLTGDVEQTIAPTEVATYIVTVTVENPTQIPTALDLDISSSVTMSIAA